MIISMVNPHGHCFTSFLEPTFFVKRNGLAIGGQHLLVIIEIKETRQIPYDQLIEIYRLNQWSSAEKT